jgi:RNA recognition motif-containing protein
MRNRKPRNKEEKSSKASRGYGFVEVEDPAQQKEAVDKVEGTLVGDRTISAKIANEMKRVEREEVVPAAEEAGVEVAAP